MRAMVGLERWEPGRRGKPGRWCSVGLLGIELGSSGSDVVDAAEWALRSRVAEERHAGGSYRLGGDDGFVFQLGWEQGSAMVRRLSLDAVALLVGRKIAGRGRKEP